MGFVRLLSGTTCPFQALGGLYETFSLDSPDIPIFLPSETLL